MNDDIVTIPEVAELLRIAEKTVYALAQRGEIPTFKVGGQWPFSRAAIDSWIEASSRASQHPPGAIERSRAAAAPSGHGSKARKRRR